MEGTRHERIALVLAAYVIGFVTAFIAFGLTGDTLYEVPDQTLTVSAAQNKDTVQPKTGVAVGEDGLFVIVDNGERMISASRTTLGASLIGTGEIPGFYTSIIDAEASRNGRFVYFCEQLLDENTTCDPYVYSLDEDALHPIKLDGQNYKSPIDGHTSAWSEESTLTLNGAISVDPSKPWLLETTPAAEMQ